MTELTSGPTSPHYDVRVSIEQFGPIEKGSFDLRPLTVFVGPSNTGKTYLAVLIYALHRTLHGFPRFPNIGRHHLLYDKDLSLSDSEALHILHKLNSKDRSILFSDLPGPIREAAHDYLHNTQLLGDDLRRELERCFDVDSAFELINMASSKNAMKLSIEVGEEGQTLWDFLMGISTSDVSSCGTISDMELISGRHTHSSAEQELMITRFRERFAQVLAAVTSQRLDTRLFRFWDLLNDFSGMENADAHYLPAARSGIMQSHRVIASSLVSHSTRAGFERFPELPTFSGVMADFMERLILFDALQPFSRVGARRRQPNKDFTNLASDLEQQTLGGKIQTARPSQGGYPEFVYRPLAAKQTIRLSRASSMVSELAPVILFIRGNVRRGDTLMGAILIWGNFLQ